MISFNCVQCGKKFLTPEHLAGRQGKCPRCGTLYTIPQPDAPIDEPTPHGATGEFVACQDPKERPVQAPEPPPEPQEPPPEPEPEPNRIRFKCEECGRKFAVSRHLEGNAGTCPDCGAMFLVPPYSDGEAPPPRPSPPPPPPVRTSRPTASMPVVLTSSPSEPHTTSKPTTMLPAPQFLSTHQPQGTSKPTATMAAVSTAPQVGSKATATVAAATAPKPSSLVEARSDKPYLDRASGPSGGGGFKLVAALLLCSLAGGGAIWAWKKVSDTSVQGQQPMTGTAVASTDPTPVPPPKKPMPPPVTQTAPPPENPVLTVPPDEEAPTYYEETPTAEPPPANPPDQTQPPTVDPATSTPIAPDAAQVDAAIADFQRQRAYVKDCPDAVQCARALDALTCVVVDKRAIEILGKILTSSEELMLVRKRAAEMLGLSFSADAVPSLSTGFEACRAHPEVGRAAIVSIGQIDSSASVKALSTIMRVWTKATDEERDHMYASVALNALSGMSGKRRGEAVDAILGLWAGLIAAKPPDPDRLSDEEWKRESHREALETASATTLSVLTGQTLGTYDEWKAWWEQNRGTLK